MNGCLFKILLIIITSIVLFFSYPHIKQYGSNFMQDKSSSLKTQGEFIKKFVREITNKKLKEIQENDDTEDQETGE